MSENQIDSVFEEEFRGDVKVAYQRKGGTLRKTVDTRDNVEGKITYFNKFGSLSEPESVTGIGDIPIDDVTQSQVACTLYDKYLGVIRRDLSLLKTSTDQKMLAAEGLAMAFGRQTDDFIITELNKASLTVGDYSTAFTNSVLMQATEKLYDNHAHEEGMVFGLLSSHAWNEFKSFAKVSGADYAGDIFPWLKGTRAIYWNDIIWTTNAALPLADADNRDIFLYHKMALGHAYCRELKVDIDWIPEKKGWLIAGDMSHGAVLIDGGSDGGVVKIKVDDNIAIT